MHSRWPGHTNRKRSEFDAHLQTEEKLWMDTSEPGWSPDSGPRLASAASEANLQLLEVFRRVLTQTGHSDIIAWGAAHKSH